MSDQQLQRVKINKLAHVGIWANDVSAQTRFYRQVMGLDQRIVTETQGSYTNGIESFLSLGDEHHSLALFNETRPVASNGRRAVQRSQLHHLAFEVSTDGELAALAARLKMAGVDLRMDTRDGDAELGDTLWLSDPDGNQIEIAVATDDTTAYSTVVRTHHPLLRPYRLQAIGLQTMHLEEMVDFYTDALGFDISDWLLRETAWLRCANDHHTIMLSQGRPGIDHIAFTASDGSELLRWSDYLSRNQTPLLWGPGRHGAGNDLFVRFADLEGIQIELSAGLQQYYDQDVTTPPRLWHTRAMALNLWGSLPVWAREEVRV